MSIERKKSEILKHGKKSGGMTNYLKYLGGKKAHLKGSVTAKCFDCMGYYIDGRNDCERPECPLYPWMPYKNDKKSSPTPIESPLRTLK